MMLTGALLLLSGILEKPPSISDVVKEFEKIEPMRGRIAFISKRENDDCRQVYTMKTDGSDMTRLTSEAGSKLFPQISPNGKMIAFVRAGKDSMVLAAPPAEGLYIIGADGQTTIEIYDGTVDGLFAWSPDSKQIAFSHPDWTNKTYDLFEGSEEFYDTECAYDVYVISLDSGNIIRLTTEGGRYPTWSPDGKQIAFVSTRQYKWKDTETKQDIYIMNSDGSNQTRIPIPRPFGNSPIPNPLSLSWSPDGKKFVFWARWGNPSIFTMDTDGSNLTQLDIALVNSTYTTIGKHPAWSPDSKQIAFNSNRNEGGLMGIYIMNADGSDIKHIVKNSRYVRAEYPTWSPP